MTVFAGCAAILALPASFLDVALARMMSRGGARVRCSQCTCGFGSAADLRADERAARSTRAAALFWRLNSLTQNASRLRCAASIK